MIPTLDKLFTDPSRKHYFEGKLLCLDPGETTGMCVFQCHGMQSPELLESGQLNTKEADDAQEILTDLFARVRPTHVVLENYLVYGWKTEEHAFNELVTPQVIGAIKFLCSRYKILPTMQMASAAKGFVTDDKLKTWKLWIKGKKHARDAIRHGVYYLLFTHNSKKEREKQDAYRNKKLTQG